MWWLWLLLAVALLVLWIVYRIAFYSDKGAWTDPYAISPEGEYQARREEMLDLISQLEHRPFVPVSVTSHDGLQLTGRYYHAPTERRWISPSTAWAFWWIGSDIPGPSRTF